MYEEVIVCECLKISLKEILKIVEQGIASIEEIQSYTKAGTICKMCVSKKYDIYGERAVHLEELIK